MTDEAPIRAWFEVSGNPFLRVIDPEMIDGEIYDERIREGQKFRIKYDRNYVVRKIVNSISPLFDLPDEKLHELINEAKNYARKI